MVNAQVCDCKKKPPENEVARFDNYEAERVGTVGTRRVVVPGRAGDRPRRRRYPPFLFTSLPAPTFVTCTVSPSAACA